MVLFFFVFYLLFYVNTVSDLEVFGVWQGKQHEIRVKARSHQIKIATDWL